MNLIWPSIAVAVIGMIVAAVVSDVQTRKIEAEKMAVCMQHGGEWVQQWGYIFECRKPK